MGKAQNEKAKKFPGQFYPGFFMCHRPGNAFGLVLSDPGKDPVCHEKKIGSICQKNNKASKMPNPVIFFSKGKGTGQSAITIDGYPKRRVRIIKL